MRRAMILVVAAALAASGSAVVLAGSAGAGPGAPVVPVTITKTVLGTDPGVAFPITLNCFSEGEVDDDSVETTDITIPNDASVSETVSLRNGESTTIQVTLPPNEPEFAGCSVTEDLAAAGIPSSYACTVAVVPESAVLYDGESAPVSVTFAVTNTCSIEQADAVNFVG